MTDKTFETVLTISPRMSEGVNPLDCGLLRFYYWALDIISLCLLSILAAVLNLAQFVDCSVKGLHVREPLGIVINVK